LLPEIRKYYPEAERRALQGALDKGDFLLPGEKRYILEAKNCARLDLAGWHAEAEVEAYNAGVPYGVIVHKRKGKTDPRYQWATLSFGAFLDLANGG
jgi:hypothetical protein